MSAHTKPCPKCKGSGRSPERGTRGQTCGRVDCPDCSGTGRVPDVEASLRAELDAARAENERLRDIIRHNVPAVVGVCSPLVNAELDKRDAEIARLRGDVEAARAEVVSLSDLLRRAVDIHQGFEVEVAELRAEVARLTEARESADRAMASVAPRARPTRAARPLSEAEQNARKPLSPLVLLGASEETIHTDTERVRAARVYRVEQDQE